MWSYRDWVIQAYNEKATTTTTTTNKI